MLILERNVDEVIVIDAGMLKPGEVIEIMLTQIGNKDYPDKKCAKFGIKAPREVAVHRKEIWNQIQRDKLAAARKS